MGSERGLRFKNDPMFQFWRLSTDTENTGRGHGLVKMIRSLSYN